MDAKEVKRLLQDAGADLTGIAGISRFGGAPKGYHPLDTLPSCKSVIAFACRFPAGTLMCKNAVPYTFARNQIVSRLDGIAFSLTAEMEKRGVLAVSIPCNDSEWDDTSKRFKSVVSVKHAAEAAGLGTIGRHSLLMTPEFGCMQFLAIVLTEAELTEDPLKENICERCGRCVAACPARALEGDRVDQAACWAHAFGEVNQNWRISCHACRDVCPHLFGTENASMGR